MGFMVLNFYCTVLVNIFLLCNYMTLLKYSNITAYPLHSFSANFLSLLCHNLQHLASSGAATLSDPRVPSKLQ